VQFTRLRLSGFKSFVEQTDLLIEMGLTGVVGPNGCGKSNLVEALRWVMGETSARQMRGGEMDDVIFGGTASRPARNVADVTLVLDNRRRKAPPQFNHLDDIEVTRRIERGEGSVYRVNGKEVRARDVQLLFADAATGARSPAMVSQGRVGALIAAKPSERRALLEEAAGIGGLHSRRHEAELRLKAAEGNLGRLEDVVVTLEGQLQGLKRQARQAARYRTISEQIRVIDAQLLLQRWRAALAALDDARDGRAQAESQVSELTALAAAAATAQAEAAAGLPALRQAEAEVAAKLQRLVVAREQLEAEQKRLGDSRRDAERRLAQIDADAQREAARGADAEQAVAKLEDEREALLMAAEADDEARAQAHDRLDEATRVATDLEADLGRLGEAIAAREAARSAAARRLAELQNRRQKLADRLAHAESQRRQAEAEAIDPDSVVEAEMRQEEAAERLEAARDALADAESRRRTTAQARDRARDQVQAEAAAQARLDAEVQALSAVLHAGQSGAFHIPVEAEVSVQPGYEAAVAAALGEDLALPLDAAAPAHWASLPPLAKPPTLPAGVELLSDFVTAPPALARRLAQVGVVYDPDLGGDLRQALAAGQRLVTPDGHLWRWDGVTVRADAPSPAAVRLTQRNRLEELREQADYAAERVAGAEERLEQATAAADAAHSAETRGRDTLKAAEAALSQAKDAHNKLAQKAATAAHRLATLIEGEERLRLDLAEATAEEEHARETAQDSEDGPAQRERLATLRADLAERRAAVISARSEVDRLDHMAAERGRRLEAIAREVESWQQRLAAAAAQQREMAERRDEALAELERLAAWPMEIEERRAELRDLIFAAEDERAEAATALAEGEQMANAAAKALRDAEQGLAAAREDRVRRDAALDAAVQQCRAVAQRISERLDTTPEKLAERVGEVEPVADDELERRLDRLNRERDAMGPVNLRAETEAAELEEQITTLKAEREDLVAAIAKLRQAIGEINREGRERLLASFRAVDQHFRDLFTRLFGGGRAHLELVESDDPLLAGLEIMASPPGKRLQILSLLSGGEQALTALALIFAVFMTNPAPICVLDEVDAPLDDANVDRFCGLVAEIGRSAATRFLVVTHHRMTMARMDRLFGVTMAERGISQLVSVDLEAAAELTESG
jgi:chromosome segregation protein